MAVVVVGASQGLGEALCQVLNERFAHGRVVGASRNRERLQRIQDRLPGLRTFACDVRSEAEMHALMKFSANSCGGVIDTLIYCSGVNFDDVVADWQSTETFRTVVETNLIGAANALHAALPYLSQSSKAHVVAITSLAGVIGCVPGGSAYAASKAGLDAFFCSCAPEMKALGIKVLIVDPGSMINRDETATRQVLGSGTRYRDARLNSKRGRPVEDVAIDISIAVERGRSGRMWSTYRAFVVGAFLAKLFLPSFLEKFALRVRFKNGGSLPHRLKSEIVAEDDMDA